MAGGAIDILIGPDTKGFDSKLAAGLKGAAGVAGKVGKGIALALAAGTAAVGFGLQSVIDKGVEYQGNLNELQAVTQATALDMRKVGDTAKALGADMTLPATSAADAAAAMVELAKGGLSVDEAMKAAKGTLQLAAAAQVDAAQAAEIQSNALNEFGLAADQAGHVADVLANAANAASGSIVDMANALKFVGPVAKGMGVSIDTVSAAIGLLANNGIQGEQAGTSLRGILASLASPSNAAAKAMKELGIVAFDQKGQFVGLRAITEQLAKAKGRLTQEEFAAAASTAFGNEGFTAANALANEGAVAFDEMATAVSRAGGAADVAGAKTKGLGGAIEGFKSQVETAGIGIFEVISGPLEAGVRRAADVVAAATPAVVSGIEHAVAAGRVFGPRLGEALRERASVVGDAIRDVLGPIAETVPDILNAGINAAIGLWEDFTDALKSGVQAAKPVAQGLADVAKSATEADGPLSAAGAALGLVGDAAKFAAGLLEPIGKIVGGIASAFADLPGPVQSAIVAMGLAAALKNPLGSLGDTVRDRVTSPFRRLGEEVRLQQALLTGSTNIMSAQIGRVGLAMAALEARVPAIGRMADAFRSTSSAVAESARANAAVIANIGSFTGEATKIRSAVESSITGVGRFAGAIAGIGAAAGSALKTGVTGLVSFLGGPWGVAFAVAGVALSIFASKQQAAARRAAETKSAIEELARTLRESGEAGGRRSIAEDLAGEFREAAEAAQGFGISLEDVVDTAVAGKPATEAIAARLRELKQIVQDDPLSDQAQRALKVIGVLNTLAGRYQGATESNKILDDAIRNGNVSMLDATGAGRDLAKAMGVLKDQTASADDRARALKDALDALSGGQIDLEAAQAQLHEGLDRLRETFKTTGDAADVARRNSEGFGKALINADGSINTTLPHGRSLLEILQGQAESMAVVAQRTFDAARAQGDDLPTALAKARRSSEAARQAFIDTHKEMGLTADQATALADRYGLLPSKVETLITAPGMSPTQQELLALRELVNKVPEDKPITVRSLSDEAKRKLIDLGFTIRELPDKSVEITANTSTAQDRLDAFIRGNQNRVIGVRVETRFVPGAGGRNLEFASGGIFAAYADGGLQRRAVPFTAGIPQIFPPNMLRITGDRTKDDEFYIPDNDSRRSLELAQEFARRRSMVMVRQFALGGIAHGNSAAHSPVPSLGEFTGTLVLDSGELLGVIRGEVREINRETRNRVLAGAGGSL